MLHNVATTETKRDRALSEYVAHRLRHQLQTTAAKDLARRAGVSGSAISQVKTGRTGVGGRVARGLAKIWGFESVEDLERAAYEWYLTRDSDTHGVAQLPQVAQAVSLVVALGQASEAEVRYVLADYGGARWRDRGSDWWAETILREVKHDRDAAKPSR
jgi:transcriptional regulator with XRE-family HTH domain